MAYNEMLAYRVRELLSGKGTVEEKKMMGGLTFMLNDKMCVGVLKEDLICRVAPEFNSEALTKTGCYEMRFGTRTLKGFVRVEPSGTDSEVNLEYWIQCALDFNKRVKQSPRKKNKLNLR